MRSWDGDYEQANYGVPVEPPYHGEKDVAPDETPIRFVLVRGLKESTSESVFAKGLEKLYRTSDKDAKGATPNSLRRVMIIRNRTTNESMRFGFAEYYAIEDAQAAITKHGELKPCTIASNPVNLDFPHKGVFPHATLGRDESHTAFAFDIFGSSHKHKYHDDRYYASPVMVNETSPYLNVKPDENGRAAEKVAVPVKKKRKVESSTAPTFERWQKQAADLRGEDGDAQTFAHVGSVIGCYLCERLFKSRDELIAHLKASSLHASSLANPEMVAKGLKRLADKGVDPTATIRLSYLAEPPEQHEPSAEYRDRAAERRQEAPKVSFSLKRSGTTSSKPEISASASEITKPSYGKGLEMLQKAGWKEGKGLGSGEGVATPIDQSLYAAGVGLGHEGGKIGDAVEEAQRSTRGDGGGFVEKTREVARKRFEGMG